MIRVVVDTNIFVSSFFGGNPRKIIDLWKTGEVALCLSRPIVDEYIISGDKHLLSIKDYMGIKVLSPKDFLDTVSGL